MRQGVCVGPALSTTLSGTNFIAKLPPFWIATDWKAINWLVWLQSLDDWLKVEKMSPTKPSSSVWYIACIGRAPVFIRSSQQVHSQQHSFFQ